MGLSYSCGHVPGRRGGGETREWKRGQEEQGKKESKTASPLKIKISSFPAWETQEARNLWKSYRYRSQESTAGCLLQQQVPHTTDVSQQRVAQSPQKPRAASRSCLGLTPEKQGQNWGQALPLLSLQAQPFLIWVNGQPTRCRATSPSRHRSAPKPARSSLLQHPAPGQLGPSALGRGFHRFHRGFQPWGNLFLVCSRRWGRGPRQGPPDMLCHASGTLQSELPPPRTGPAVLPVPSAPHRPSQPC